MKIWNMEKAGAAWVDEPAFREGNLVWGRVVADIPDYCRELVKALSDCWRIPHRIMPAPH